MAAQSGGSGTGRGSGALHVAAGLADLALDGAGAALRGLRGVLARADLVDLAEDGRQELAARGRLALRRCPSLPESHMEELARRAGTRPVAGDV